MSRPQTLGLRKTFGFGDRLGLATPGHLAAARQFDFAPVFAQQSIREMTRTQRTPEEVMNAAVHALNAAGFTGAWGADGDHLKTPEDVQRVAAAGFCWFTIDPSSFVHNGADGMSAETLEREVTKLQADGIMEVADWRELYLGRRFDVGEGDPLVFDPVALERAAVKYGRAIAHTSLMGQAIRTAMDSTGSAFEIEVSVDETDTPTSPFEHLFYGMELKRRGVPNVVSLAPRFVGEFEKGIDYKGDILRFESELRRHVAIARFCGPYKLSVHSGSDKFAVYPIIGRLCGNLLHVKTAGTSYLEALRTICRTDPRLFAEIAEYSRSRFDADRASYHLATTASEVKALPPFRESGDEQLYLDETVGRQLLHVTFGSVLTVGTDAAGQSFKSRILECLGTHRDLHEELICKHFVRHLQLLNQG